MQSEPLSTKLRENQIIYKKQKGEGKSTRFFSLPWSYLLGGVSLFLVGLLDYFLLGNLIGHPEHPNVGEYIGQGIAVFLGGVSFFYTVGLIPLVVGLIMLLYCLFSVKEVTFASNGSIYSIQERRILFPTYTELDVASIKKTTYLNKGVKFKHSWMLLFIPMAVRILQFGVPLFGEPRAQDDILPTMMVITALIDIIIIVIILLAPNHRLSFDTEDKKYITNFFPVTGIQSKSLEILQLFDLPLDSTRIGEDFWTASNPQAQLKHGTQKSQGNYSRIIFAGILILASLIGASFEFLWGTDLCMVGITYGIYVLLQALQYDFLAETSLMVNHENTRCQFQSTNGSYFTYIKINGSNSTENALIEPKFRSINFVDVVGMGLLLFLSTLEFLWSWGFLNIFNGLILIDLICTTIIWIALVFGCFIYLVLPIDYLRLGKAQSGDMISVYRPDSKYFSLNDLKSLKTTLSTPSLKREGILRIFTIGLIVLLALVVAIF